MWGTHVSFICFFWESRRIGLPTLINRFSTVVASIALGVLITLIAPAGVLKAQQTTFPDCAANLPQAELDRRIDDLIQKMTPAERIAQLQDRAPGIQRLGIPAYNWWNEGLHGIARNGYATVFPQAIGLAATWDPALLERVGDVVSTEARAKFNSNQNADSQRYAGVTIWSPNINIFRDPRWGRGQETYGEDPYLTGLMGSNFVRGIQGERADVPASFYRKADATPKHFAVHSGPESIRDGFNSVVSQHDIADTYTPAFRALAGANGAKAAALMCSYNAINGIPACANPLLQNRLRDAWGFNGYVVSDCDAVDEITDYHHYTKDQAHGVALGLKAGTDLDCGNSYAHLQESLDQKLVTIDDIDRSLHRLMLERLRLGMLQPASCSPWMKIGPDEVDTPQARSLALKVAEESMVLLKNDDHLLPMNFAGKRIAVIGPTGNLLEEIEANYHGTVRNPERLAEGFARALNAMPRRAQVMYAQGSMLAEGVSIPVPPTALRTGKGSDAAGGLMGEFFANPDLKPDLNGKPVTTRIDGSIDYDLDRVAPVEGLPERYSARWTGYLKPPAAGKYRLKVAIERCWDCKIHDAYRLVVDDKTVLEDDGAGSKQENADGVAKPDKANGVTFDWADTKAHAVTLELRHTGDDEGIRLDWEAPAEAQLAEAVAAAKKADMVVAMVGLSPDLEGEALQIKVPGFDGGDRVTLGLPEPQKKLLTELGKLGKPMVIVLTSGSAVALGKEADGAKAVIETWYPGEAGGAALARLLSGEVSPSGRMPVTVYRSEADLPAFTDYSMAHRTYRYFDGPVEYPFGFGLGYSQFTYAAPKLSVSQLQAGESLQVRATVTNSGTREADEVAELYLIPATGAGGPRLTLQGIDRLHLKAGESADATFVLTPRQLSFVDADGKRAIRAGRYRIVVGGAQPASLDSGGAELEISGEKSLEP
jgi:beta-glucosidase